jgi:hypothetical protein
MLTILMCMSHEINKLFFGPIVGSFSALLIKLAEVPDLKGLPIRPRIDPTLNLYIVFTS